MAQYSGALMNTEFVLDIIKPKGLARKELANKISFLLPDTDTTEIVFVMFFVLAFLKWLEVKKEKEIL